MTPARFRKLALSMPDAVEGAHHDHPDFRANGRIFASLHPDGVHGMVRLAPAEQERLVRQFGGTFAPANGAWGRAGCTNVHLPTADAGVLKDAMTLAWQAATERAPGARVRGKTARSAKRSTKRS